MAHYEGQTLKQRLAQGPMTVDEALSVATQVADGLARAHAAGVVHRDIKPGNVILTDDRVKIVDFGLATLAGSVQITQAGSPMGTVGYMAPEQLRGLGAVPQSDVWAAGVMLYEMLAGHPPFQGAYAEALSYAIRHDTPPPLRPEHPEIPEEVEQLVFRALHKDPAVRFASGRELARALRQVQGRTVPLDLQTAACTLIKAGAYPNSLSFVPVGTLDPNLEALVGYFGNSYVRVNAGTGVTSVVGTLSGGYMSSGDIVSVEGGGSFLTVTGNGCGDCLLQVDPKTGDMIQNYGALPHGSVYGLGYWAGTLFGFDANGDVFSIGGGGDAGLVTSDITIGDGGVTWWGAGSTTIAPAAALDGGAISTQ